MDKKKFMSFKLYEFGKKVKTIRCDVTGAEYNRRQKARNCIARAVSKLGCEEGRTNFKRKRVNINCAVKRLLAEWK